MRIAMVLLCALVAILGYPAAVSGQEAPTVLRVDLIVPATFPDDRRPTSTCVYLPAEASVVKVSRRPFVEEAKETRPLYMSIRPWVSTATPIVERVNITSDLVLTIPELGYETCFEFENTMGQFEAQGVAQSYKYFAQVVSLEVR